MVLQYGRMSAYVDDMVWLLNRIKTGQDLAKHWDNFPAKQGVFINTARYTIYFGEKLEVYPLIGSPNAVYFEGVDLLNATPLDPSVLSPEEVQLVKTFLFGIVVALWGVLLI